MLEEIWIMGDKISVSAKSYLTKLKALIVECWDNIVKLTQTSLLALVQTLAPSLSALIKDAHVLLDKVVAPVRLAAKTAWNELRNYLLEQIVDIFQLEDGQWIYRTISVLLLPKAKKPRRIVEDTPIEFYELSANARERLIRNGRINKLDFTKTRDAEFDKLDDLTA